RDQRVAVRGENERRRGGCVQAQAHLAGDDVPELDRPVNAGGGERLAVGVEGDGRDVAAVAAQHGPRPGRRLGRLPPLPPPAPLQLVTHRAQRRLGNVPQEYRVVLLNGGQQAVVVRQRQRLPPVAQRHRRLQYREHPAGRRVPGDKGRPVLPGEDALAVGGEE